MKSLDLLILTLASALFFVCLFAVAVTLREKPVMGAVSVFVLLALALADLVFMWCVIRRGEGR